MTNYREILIALALRVPPAAILFGGGWYILVTAEGGWGAFPRLVVGVGCLVLTGVVLGPSLARLVAEPLGAIFCPTGQYDRPQPMYSIPQSNRKKGLHKEAMLGFQKIADEYPEQVQAYVEMIDMAIVDLKDANLARSLFRKGTESLTEEVDRVKLATMYEAIRSRLESRAVRTRRLLSLGRGASGAKEGGA